jgi:hypothetical protein
MQLDVKKCFGSISHAWLEEYLTLPKAMIATVVYTASTEFIPFGNGLQCWSRLQIGHAADRDVAEPN